MQKIFLTVFALAIVGSCAFAQDSTKSIVDANFLAEERDGFVAVEAEHFASQEKAGVRAFYLTTPTQHPKADSDGDPPHWLGASGNAYVEILPDTRRNHSEKLTGGVNFSNVPGKLAVLNYKIHFNTPGRYYVWVRAYSTGSEDNGLHVGIDGTWPEHGQRMQWCDGKHSWWWESKQRTEKVHCGVADEIWIDVPTAGEHTISFSMREDGFEFDKFLMTTDKDFQRPADAGAATVLKSGSAPAFELPSGPAGDGTVSVEADKVWDPVTITQSGPYAYETHDLLDSAKPNPFMDYRMEVTFSQGDQSFTVPGYFAADGNAAESSAKSGNAWRAHFSPSKAGDWKYEVSFVSGKGVAIDPNAIGTSVASCDGKSGTFKVDGPSKPGNGDQSRTGMLLPKATHLVFAESGKPFFKVGPDAPETLLAFRDFDGTRTLKPKPGPLKSFKNHVQDANETDPTWKNGKGKGLLGAVNYLASKGLNSMSFLTYNVDGDGANVWPHVSPTDKMHFDCSKLDQWSRVFHHAQFHNILLHFKLQETENDDWRHGTNSDSGKEIAGALDGGKCGPQRKLYLRELVARFGHLNMLEWNLGEENTQTFEEQMAMAVYLDSIDAYGHNIALHTYPQQQDKVYDPWLGKAPLTGLSLQNMWDAVHKRTLLWVNKSRNSDHPWVVANDEQGQADQGVPPDPGYAGFDGTVTMKNGRKYDLHDIRKRTLWGNLMAGGAGVMYYFGYALPENDLKCEDFRSRDKSWDYCQIAKEFLLENEIPIHELKNMNGLVGNKNDGYGNWCLAKPGSLYLVYLPEGGKVSLELSKESVDFEAFWFDPENGGELSPTKVANQRAATEFDSGVDAGKDRVLLLRAK
ncbi:DUF5060 domain-containing protein [Mariniblastus fucicola]|uniref:DUF5060 domain-containing protein n=1 Tax=Mariniblastus fucicola TaxID=980251 RepID=A0A5B9P460_9BACT|nr:DUF5060 domain-containing protein [Mariniblastus fucicola]QEG21188.1 hypothetical protein MFFC18_10430 [Mariniblastus fucicola]